VPQLGQKRRCIMLPLSAMLRKSRSSPWIVTASLGKHAFTVALPAPIYWQTRHQHVRVTIGGAVAWYRTEPHRHPPVISIYAFSQAGRKRQYKSEEV